LHCSGRRRNPELLHDGGKGAGNHIDDNDNEGDDGYSASPDDDNDNGAFPRRRLLSQEAIRAKKTRLGVSFFVV
jgi:hypothetical protein